VSLCSVPGCEKKSRKRGWCQSHYLRWWRHGDPTGGGSSKGAAQTFLSASFEYDGDECLIWPFYRTKEGYGAIHLRGRCRIVSRVVCEQEHGPPPDDKSEAAHSCGNGHLGCVNRNHLRWATYAENRTDMMDHGRSNRGEKNSRSKLTRDQVIMVREALNVCSQQSLAEKYGVSPSAISLIKSGHTWAWLQEV
jgi:hypothetical protein